MELALDGGPRGMNVESENTGASHVGRDNLQNTDVDFSLCGERGGTAFVKRDAALSAQRRSCSLNFYRLEGYDRLGVIDSNWLCNAEFQRLVFSLENRNRQMRLKFCPIFQRTLQSRVQLGLALKALRHAGGVRCHQRSKRDGVCVDGSYRLVVASKGNGSSGMNRGLRYAGIKIEVRAVLCDPNLCLESRDCILAHLQLRQLHGCQQLWIVQRAGAVDGGIDRAIYFEILLLDGSQLLQHH